MSVPEIPVEEGREPMDCMFPAASLLRYESPIRVVRWYVVECQCGWKSQRTTDWQKSLDGHLYRQERKRAAA